MTDGVESARDIKLVLTLAVKASENIVEQALKSLENDYLQLSSQYATEIDYSENRVTQSLEPNCICNYEIIEQNSKSTTKRNFVFNLIDINTNTLAK